MLFRNDITNKSLLIEFKLILLFSPFLLFYSNAYVKIKIILHKLFVSLRHITVIASKPVFALTRPWFITNCAISAITTKVVLSVRAPFMARYTGYNIMWWSFLVTCDRSVIFSGTPVSSINKSDRHDIAEILLKVSLNTINHKSTRPCCVLSWRVSNANVIVVGLKPTIYHTRGEHVSFFLSLYISTNKGHPACKRNGAKTSYLKLSPWYILNIILCFIKFLYLC